MPYEVVAPIARGGMGIVELGRAPDGSAVALKRLTLQGTAAEMAAARRRIHREAEILHRFDHPAIVELIEVLDEDGEIVLVMPHLPGGTLADRVNRRGPMAEREVLELATLLLGALAAAHRAGVVHRDVKPGNVLFDEDGRAMLVDFGIATTRDGTPGLTGDGLVVGTPGYLAPEQARGEPASMRSDVFSLGATLFFAATGESPFGRGDPRVTLYRAADGDVATIPRAVGADLRRLLRVMLEPRADRRPAAAELAGGPDGTTQIPAARRRSRLLVPAVIGALALAGAAAVGTAELTDRDGASDPSARSSATTGSTPSTTACDPLPYRPCGQPDAPFTDGQRCIDDHDDYDGDARNGCEAAPLGPDDGAEIDDVIEANIVPADDTDTFAAVVDDRRQLLCDGDLRFELTAPAGTSLRLRVLAPSGEVRGETVSADGVTAELSFAEPSCGGDDGTTLTLEVTPIGSDRSAEPYRLTRSGSF